MCIRDSCEGIGMASRWVEVQEFLLMLDQAKCPHKHVSRNCLLYTSDAADDLLCVDLGGRRIIKKKNNKKQNTDSYNNMKTKANMSMMSQEKCT